MLAERRRDASAIRRGRAALWGGLSSGLTVLAMIGWPPFAIVTAVVGAGAGFLAASLAKRGAELSSGAEAIVLPAGEA